VSESGFQGSLNASRRPSEPSQVSCAAHLVPCSRNCSNFSSPAKLRSTGSRLLVSACRLEEEEKLVMTPFEKNLEVWRQLWRVLERSDYIFQVVDARDPLFYRSTDLEAYSRCVTPFNHGLLRYPAGISTCGGAACAACARSQIDRFRSGSNLFSPCGTKNTFADTRRPLAHSNHCAITVQSGGFRCRRIVDDPLESMVDGAASLPTTSVFQQR
jgi:hypothetical protein